MTYKETLRAAMAYLAKQPNTLFVGQSVKFGGQAMFSTFEDVPMEQRIEFPVAENMQMGYCTGLELEGFVPISVFPRFDFLLSAMDQLVNHLDKIPQISKHNPKVIIRTAVGSSSPLNPGPQHTQDHTEALRMMLKNIPVIDLFDKELILPSYQRAIEREGSIVIVEYASMYGN